MLRVTTNRTARNLVWLALPVSIGMHLALYLAAREGTRPRPRPAGASQVAFKIKALPPPPEKPAASPPPPSKPRPVVRKPAAMPAPAPRAVPRANTAQPPEPSAAPAQPVFGVTADSVAAAGGGAAVRVGNTLQKTMEKAVTLPEQVQALPPPPAEPPRPAPPKPVPTYALTRSPAFAHKVEPTYPAAEREEGIEGTVQLEVLIDAKGCVRKVRVLKAPTRSLARAAVAALRESRFTPGYVDQTPVAVTLKIPYRFVLNG